MSTVNLRDTENTGTAKALRALIEKLEVSSILTKKELEELKTTLGDKD